MSTEQQIFFEWAKLLVATGTGGFLVYRIVLLSRQIALLQEQIGLVQEQIRSNHEWNRRKAAHDLVTQLMFGRFADLRKLLSTHIDVYDRRQSYAEPKGTILEQDRRHLADILNCLEGVCVGIKHGVADEVIAYDCVAEIMTAHWRWAERFAEEMRADGGVFWPELEKKATEWEHRLRPGPAVKEPRGPL